MDPDALDFLSPPPDFLQLKCPICLELLESPYLFTCCGNHICGTCITSLEGCGPCPMCKACIYDKVLNKSQQRAASSLKVRCLNNKKGCEWTGEIKQLKTHLTQSNGNCQYELYDCKYNCGESFLRSSLTDHETNKCIKRQIECQYCNKYHSTYEDVTSIHYEVCPLYPVLCPNDCGNNVKRIELDTHTSTHCPRRKVNCEFVGIGCKWSDREEQLGQHLEEKWREHIALAMSHSAVEIAELQRTVTKLSMRVEILELQAGALDSPVVAKKRLPLEDLSVDSLESVVQIEVLGTVKTSKGTMIPFYNIPDHEDTDNVTASLIVNRWHHKSSHNNLHRSHSFSVPGYPHYKLQVTVHCNGIRNAKGSYVSVFANICTEILVFGQSPSESALFSGQLLISLLSSVPGYENKYGLIIFDDSVNDLYRKTTRDGVEIGIEEFIPFEDVGFYLKPDDDSLHFQIHYFEV